MNDTTPFRDIPQAVARADQRLTRLARRRVHRYTIDLELMCETALQGGRHGVLVVWTGMEYRMTIDERVPFGVIWEKRT
jgi:hypothetical protein